MSGNSEKEDLAQLAIELIDNKRVNRDNAFDVKLSFLENLAAEINEKKDKENAWSKASVSIDVSSKVYGYRVDSLHNHAFRISGSLHRSDPLSKNIEQASKLLKEAELGITESKQKSKNNIRKFYAGERTLEKDISNLDKDIIGLEFEIDPLFHHVTAKFDESKTSSLLLNITPVNNQAELSFFNEKSCVKGDEDRYWRLLNPAKAAKEDFEEEERLIQKGENHKPKPKFGKHRESDDVMLQSMFKSFLLSISKFSNPPIRKSCLLHEVESILYKKLKYQDNQCNKLKKKLYESHKTKIKAQSISDKSKLSKRFKAEDEDFKNVKGVFIEKEQLGKKPETNDGASHALADKINTHGQSHPSPFAKDHSDKGIENQDDQSVSLMAGENGEDSIPPMIEDNTGMEHSEPIEQLPQDEPSGHDFSNLNMDEPAEGTESQKKKPKLFLQNVDQENDTAMVNSSTIQKSKNIGTGVQNKKLKHREEFVLAQLNKSGKFLKDADKKGAKKGGNDLENALFHRTQLEDQEERIRKEQKEIRRKRRDLKFKALATAKILNEDYDNFLIDNNPKEKKRFQYPLFSLGKLTTCDTFYEYKAHSTMLSFDSKQAHLATYNGIDINKDPFEDF